MVSSSEHEIILYARKKARRGLTLIEAAMVLTILALVVGAVMLYYSSANSSQKASAASGNLGAIQQAVRSAYAGQPNYVGLTNATIVNSLPRSMSDAGGQIYHAFAGKVTVVAADVGGGAGSGFSIQMDGVPKEGCQKLGALDLGRSVNSETINATPVVFPVTAIAAQTDCTSAGANSLIWTFY